MLNLITVCLSLLSWGDLKYALPKNLSLRMNALILNVIKYDMEFMKALYKSSWTVNITAELFSVALFQSQVRPLLSTVIVGTKLKCRHTNWSGTSCVTDFGKLYTGKWSTQAGMERVLKKIYLSKKCHSKICSVSRVLVQKTTWVGVKEHYLKVLMSEYWAADSTRL